MIGSLLRCRVRSAGAPAQPCGLGPQLAGLLLVLLRLLQGLEVERAAAAVSPGAFFGVLGMCLTQSSPALQAVGLERGHRVRLHRSHLPAVSLVLIAVAEGDVGSVIC